MPRPVLLCLALLAACAYHAAPLTAPADPRYAKAAPDSFDVRFETTKGTMLVRAHRSWSPSGVDRFYALAKNNYFDSIAFYRTISGFVAQFGFSGDPKVNAAWEGKTIPDDTVRVSNVRGTMSFARGGPHTRSTQFFFNSVDNTRLDAANGYGFPPIAQVIRGVDVLDKLNHEYGGVQGVVPAPAGPQQGTIAREGNAYLRREFPRLDYIMKARIVKQWRR
jgi:peptidyl-prolyl cis-trans isomerase A (cyclophilin A)